MHSSDYACGCNPLAGESSLCSRFLIDISTGKSVYYMLQDLSAVLQVPSSSRDGTHFSFLSGPSILKFLILGTYTTIHSNDVFTQIHET